MIFKENEYKFIHELNSGRFGKTVFIKDNSIDELFICKKYDSQKGINKKDYFKNSQYILKKYEN